MVFAETPYALDTIPSAQNMCRLMYQFFVFSLVAFMAYQTLFKPMFWLWTALYDFMNFGKEVVEGFRALSPGNTTTVIATKVAKKVIETVIGNMTTPSVAAART